MFNSIPEILEDLKKGKMVIVVDDEDAAAVADSGAIKPTAAQVHRPQAQFFRNSFRFIDDFLLLVCLVSFLRMLCMLPKCRRTMCYSNESEVPRQSSASTRAAAAVGGASAKLFAELSRFMRHVSVQNCEDHPAPASPARASSADQGQT